MSTPAPAFQHQTYTLRRKVLTIAGAKFHIYGPDGRLVLFSKLKAFKLKEDIRMYASEAMERELLVIRTQSIWDISGTYDVFDPIANETVGALKRHGMKSMLQDEWSILDATGQPIGKIKEDSAVKAIARRFFEPAALLMPQAYHVDIDGQPVATFRQHFNPIVQKIAIDFSPDTGDRLDPRLGFAAAVLMCAIEGRQN